MHTWKKIQRSSPSSRSCFRFCLLICAFALGTSPLDCRRSFRASFSPTASSPIFSLLHSPLLLLPLLFSFNKKIRQTEGKQNQNAALQFWILNFVCEYAREARTGVGDSLFLSLGRASPRSLWLRLSFNAFFYLFFIRGSNRKKLFTNTNMTQIIVKL